MYKLDKTAQEDLATISKLYTHAHTHAHACTDSTLKWPETDICVGTGGQWVHFRKYIVSCISMNLCYFSL